MAKFMSVLLIQLLIVGLLQCAMADHDDHNDRDDHNDHDVHVVGDQMGWNIPQAGGPTYRDWANDEDFEVGDTLVFNFTTGAHDVLEVPKTSFEACSQQNPIGAPMKTGPARVNLTSAGERFFICTIGQHCQMGQKLAITVMTSRGTPTTPTVNNPKMSPPDMMRPSDPPMSAMPPSMQGASGSTIMSANSFWSLIFASFMVFSMSWFY